MVQANAVLGTTTVYKKIIPSANSAVYIFPHLREEITADVICGKDKNREKRRRGKCEGTRGKDKR
jgi:hypothetical protein